MLSGTFQSLLSTEGYLDLEAHESDLRGSRGVALAGALMMYMGVANFANTVRPDLLSASLYLDACGQSCICNEGMHVLDMLDAVREHAGLKT